MKHQADLPKKRGKPRQIDLPGVSDEDRVRELTRIRVARRRKALLEAGKVPLTVMVPVEVMSALNAFLQFKDETKDHLVERVLRDRLLRKR